MDPTGAIARAKGLVPDTLPDLSGDGPYPFDPTELAVFTQILGPYKKQVTDLKDSVAALTNENATMRQQLKDTQIKLEQMRGEVVRMQQANSQKDNQILLMAKYLDDIDIQERLLTNLVRRARAGSETLASLVADRGLLGSTAGLTPNGSAAAAMAGADAKAADAAAAGKKRPSDVQLSAAAKQAKLANSLDELANAAVAESEQQTEPMAVDGDLPAQFISVGKPAAATPAAAALGAVSAATPATAAAVAGSMTGLLTASTPLTVPNSVPAMVPGTNIAIVQPVGTSTAPTIKLPKPTPAVSSSTSKEALSTGGAESKSGKPRQNRVRTFKEQVVNIPEEVKDACRRHWAQHQRVRVVCDGKRGTFMLQNGCIPVVLVDGKDGELVSPNLFEKLSGKEACKNWQQSIKVEGFTMTGDPSGPGMKMGHFVRIVGIQTSNSATEYGM